MDIDYASIGKNLPILDKLKVRPMNGEEIHMFMRCYQSHMNGMFGSVDVSKPIQQDKFCDVFNTLMPSVTLPIAMQILITRLPNVSQGYYLNTLLFLASLSDRPGISVILAWWLYTETVKIGSAISMEDIGKDYFPMGVPTEESYSKIWDAQKGSYPIDNMLDQSELWSSYVA